MVLSHNEVEQKGMAVKWVILITIYDNKNYRIKIPQINKPQELSSLSKFSFSLIPNQTSSTQITFPGKYELSIEEHRIK